MTLLSRVLAVVTISFALTLLLMVVHWEPGPSPVPTPPPEAASGPRIILAAATPRADWRAADAGPLEPPVDFLRDSRFRDDEGTAWLMRGPRDIEELSDEIQTVLWEAGCLVPTSRERPNVTWGEFRQPGQTDLAVLCARADRAAVYVFWDGNAYDADISDLPYILGTSLDAVSAAHLQRELTGYSPVDPGMPQQIRHDGLEIGPACCRTTLYFHRGRWRLFE